MDSKTYTLIKDFAESTSVFRVEQVQTDEGVHAAFITNAAHFDVNDLVNKINAVLNPAKVVVFENCIIEDDDRYEHTYFFKLTNVSAASLPVYQSNRRAA